MPIRLIDSGDIDLWDEQDDAIRVFFDSGVLLDQAGMSIQDAYENPATFVPVLEESLGEAAAENDLRSPGPQYGPHAGGGIPSFLDVVVLAKDLAEVAAVAFVIVRRLREIGVRGVHVSERGIESLARRELRVHGHPETASRVAVGRIPSPDRPGRWVGYATIFRLDDGRLVTQRRGIHRGGGDTERLTCCGEGRQYQEPPAEEFEELDPERYSAQEFIKWAELEHRPRLMAARAALTR